MIWREFASYIERKIKWFVLFTYTKTYIGYMLNILHDFSLSHKTRSTPAGTPVTGWLLMILAKTMRQRAHVLATRLGAVTVHQIRRLVGRSGHSRFPVASLEVWLQLQQGEWKKNFFIESLALLNSLEFAPMFWRTSNIMPSLQNVWNPYRKNGMMINMIHCSSSLPNVPLILSTDNMLACFNIPSARAC